MTRPQRMDDGNAFLPDPFDNYADHHRRDDETADFAEELGEEYVTSVTGNVDITELELDQVRESEYGGPYTISTANEEIALDDDPQNPSSATREPFPAPMRGNAELAPRR